MTQTEAMAEVFLTALKALPKTQRDAVVVRIARDEEFVHSIIDLSTISKRCDEPSRPFREYLVQTRGR